jgi:DNA-binding transcriptional ArsR family regulator
VRDHLLSEESAAHFEASARIERERAVLAAPAEPAQHLQSHLAIAEAYLTMAARERDRALQLAERHGLQAQAAPALAGLRRVFEREQPREQQLAAAWQAPTADLLDDTRRLALVERLLRDGELSKASYGEAAGVAPATASKHLALLTERGLLAQTGRGPATRYRLPDGG